MDKPRPRKAYMILPLLVATGILLPVGEGTSQAGYFNDIYNNIQQFSELPDDINELKDSYQRALQELDRARIDTEVYRQQNADLAEQNRQLTEMINHLQEAEAARKRNAERLKTVGITAAALLAGYFILTRALRFGMRRSNRRF